MDNNLSSALGKFTPVPEVLIKKFGVTVGAVWSKIWYHEQGKNGFCSTSYNTLGEELNISAKTIQRSVKILIDNNLIFDVSPIKLNKPGVTRHYKTNKNKFNQLLSMDILSYVESDSTDILSSTMDNLSTTKDILSNSMDILSDKNELRITKNNIKNEENNAKFYIDEIKKLTDPMKDQEYFDICKDSLKACAKIEGYWDLTDLDQLKKILNFCRNYKK